MKPILSTVASGALIALLVSTAAQAAPVSEVTQALNTLQANAFPGLTDTQQVSVDQAAPQTVGAGVEIPGFGLGTYDVDVSGDGIEMTFLPDPASLGIAVYDDQTFDRYDFGFDKAIATASIDSLNTNPAFSAMVEVISPGANFTFDGILGFPGVDPTLPTELSMPNGGLLITIGDGTNLFDVGTGGTLNVSFSAVPLPAPAALLLAGLAGLGLARRRAV